MIFITSTLELLSSSIVIYRMYDYTGYGQSSRKVRSSEINRTYTGFRYQDAILHTSDHLFLPSEQNTYADIEAAYRCLEETYGVKEEDVILYGQSVGSGPTLDLASHLLRLRAVILHSPI
ncbi:hypothetical protein L2E82_40867 [Cichorium intybus]|uniref:Uncharacterized protein n=1 Tax=Cichorium intybus TaxID=13427 RepID=A0ACB9AN46_CICIN|nr:hypothetical protein L2E82_40867 [Cichorium intybus]